MDPVLLGGLTRSVCAVTLGISAVAIGADERQRVQRSLAAVAATRVGGAPVLVAQEESFADRVVIPVFRWTGRLARRFSAGGVTEKLQARLDVAGNPRGWTVERVLSLKGFGLVLGAVLGFLFGSGRCDSPAADRLRCLRLLPAGRPRLQRATKRQQQLARTLPDSMDLLTISVEAGLGFDAALSQVARNTDGPLAGEFFRVLQEMQIGKTRAEAFRSLSERTTVPELRQFVSSLVQADQFGIPVANVLREQSKELRVKRRQVAEEKAQKVPVTIMVPLVLFIFPVIFIVIMGPAAAGWMSR